ncbi:MAG: creatininase family protein [Ruminococcaceae bacterium]|nr:creatininase family protein [Oscillospiraceae bacterium]
MASIHMATSYPKEVMKAREEHWPVLIPVGNIEYHSDHCPYGTDALVAQGIAEEVGKKMDCMIMPAIWYGCSSYAVGGPETGTLNTHPDVLEDYVYGILKSLLRAGFNRNICLIIAHQTEEFLPQTLACMKAAKKLTFEYLEETRGQGWWGDNKNAGFYDNLESPQDNPWNWIRVFNGCRFPDSYPSDHGGKYECGKLEVLYPGSIKLDRLTEDSAWFSRNAPEMDLEHSKKTIEHVVNSIIEAIKTGKKCY